MNAATMMRVSFEALSFKDSFWGARIRLAREVKAYKGGGDIRDELRTCRVVLNEIFPSVGCIYASKPLNQAQHIFYFYLFFQIHSRKSIKHQSYFSQFFCIFTDISMMMFSICFHSPLTKVHF